MFAWAGCGGDARENGGSDVVAAFYPLAYAAQEIGRGAVSVENLTPPGAEPHDVELSPRMVERVQSADLVLYLGGGFQPALERAVDGAEGKAVDLLRAVRGRRAGDLHVWLDPVRYEQVVETIGGLVARSRRARAFGRRLDRLDRQYRRGLSTCRRRELVTSHRAFGYLAERYGLEEIAITGLSPEAEPTPRELERVIDKVRRSGATTIFTETLLSPRLAETVARETGATTAVLNPVEGLSEEELDKGENYFSVMRANLRALRKGLGCS